MNTEPIDEQMSTTNTSKSRAECQYLDIVREILDKGEIKDNRTGDDCHVIPPRYITHDIGKDGFPLITTKKMGIKTIARELQWFIAGMTTKSALRDRKCNIWNQWCNPDIINKIDFSHKTAIREACLVYSVNEEEFKTLADVKFDEGKSVVESRRLAFQELIDDLGPVYGYQWRRFNQNYINGRTMKYPIPPAAPGHELKMGDQLAYVINTLKRNPNDRRMHVSAWNPLQQHQQALPPCHLGFTVQHINGTLHLVWQQR